MATPMGREKLVELLDVATVGRERLGMAWEFPDRPEREGEGIVRWTYAKAHSVEGHVTLHDDATGPARYFVRVATITRVWDAQRPDHQRWP